MKALMAAARSEDMQSTQMVTVADNGQLRAYEYDGRMLRKRNLF